MDRYNEIVNKVRSDIGSGTDYSLIEQLENVNNFKKRQAFRNYLVFLLILIEESKYRETASAILINKVYEGKIFLEEKYESAEELGEDFLNTIKQYAVFPYVNVSFFLQKIFRTIIYSRGEDEAKNIVQTTSHKKLLQTNEHLLLQYLRLKDIDDYAINIYCNSFADIKNGIVILSDRAKAIFRAKVLGTDYFKQPDLISYLKIFIRPLFSYPGGKFEGVNFYVPEPFYNQTFGDSQEFMGILKELMNDYSGNDLYLIKDILTFLTKYETTKEDFVSLPIF